MKRKYFQSQARFRLTERKKLLLKSAADPFAGQHGGEKKAAAPAFRELKTRKQQARTELGMKPGQYFKSRLWAPALSR